MTPRDALAKLPPGPYRVEWPAEQGGLFTLWGRQGTLPDFKDGWAIPLVACGAAACMYALADLLNAALPSGGEREAQTQECETCGGNGWVPGIGADPLPSGEPGEPYQVQETCPDCGGAGVLPVPDGERETAGLREVATDYLADLDAGRADAKQLNEQLKTGYPVTIRTSSFPAAVTSSEARLRAALDEGGQK